MSALKAESEEISSTIEKAQFINMIQQDIAKTKKSPFILSVLRIIFFPVIALWFVVTFPFRAAKAGIDKRAEAKAAAKAAKLPKAGSVSAPETPPPVGNTAQGEKGQEAEPKKTPRSSSSR